MDINEAAPNQLVEMKQNQPMSSNGKMENGRHAAKLDTPSNNVEQNP